MEEAKQGFESLGLTRQFLNALDDQGIVDPTPIQLQAIPIIRAGHDLIGIAQTGTGKTAAFGLPLLQKVKYAQGEIPRALVLEPTRELVIQTTRHLQTMAKYTDLRIMELYGGRGFKEQKESLAHGVDVIVSTPGRLMEMYFKGHLILKGVKTLILDEADRLMDMGFMPKLRNILEVIPVKRQNLLFSATFGTKVEELSHEFLEFPRRVEVSPQATPAETVEQRVYELPNFKTKLLFLEQLLTDAEWYRVLVFCRTKDRAERVSRYLERKVEGGVKVIHGNKGQNTRLNAFIAFQEGELRVLVATDVTARGIDISQVSHVVNFDVPRHAEDYTHRIGRTGRAGHSGIAVTMMDPSEGFHIQRIEEVIDGRIPISPMPQGLTEQEYLPGEKKEMALEKDRQRRITDPTYKGAFHKRKPKSEKKKKRRR